MTEESTLTDMDKMKIITVIVGYFCAIGVFFITLTVFNIEDAEVMAPIGLIMATSFGLLTVISIRILKRVKIEPKYLDTIEGEKFGFLSAIILFSFPLGGLISIFRHGGPFYTVEYQLILTSYLLGLAITGLMFYPLYRMSVNRIINNNETQQS